MGDMADVFNEYKKYVKEKRRSNTVSSTQLLVKNNVAFEAKNGGAHLIVNGNEQGFFDFWPSSGIWICRTTKKKGHGVFRLLKQLKGN